MMENLQNISASFKESAREPFTPEKISYIILAITAFLLPIFFIPSNYFSLEVSKSILLVVGVIASLFLFLLNIVKRGEFQFPRHKIFLAIVFLPIIFLVSAFLGTNPSFSLFGYILETGSWAFITLGFFIVFLSSILFRTKERIFYFYLSFLAGLLITLVIALVKLFFGGSLLSFGVLEGTVANPVGSWTDLAVFISVGVTAIVIALETIPLQKVHRVLLLTTLVASLFVLSVLNFSSVWLLLLIFSLVFFVYIASFQNVDFSGNKERRISYSALLVLIVSILFFFNPSISGSGRLSDTVATIFNVSNLEVRPSLSATKLIVESTLSERPIFGSGPNTFNTEWLLRKPLDVNLSNFWNLDFPSGFGLLPTFVATSGILGTLAWLLFLGLFLRLGVRAIFAEVPERFSRFLITSSFLSALFLWIMSILYVPSASIFALTFFFTGLFIASAISEGIISLKVISFGHSAKLSFVTILTLIALLLGNVVFAYGALTKSISSKYFSEALAEVNESGDIDKTIERLNKAINLSGHDIYYRALSQVYVIRVNQILEDASITDNEKSRLFQESLRDSIISAQAAIDSNRLNYQNWLSLGRIYESLVPAPLSIEGSYDSAKGAYLEALQRNPNSPEIYLFLARLEVMVGNIESAREYINQSLTKKNNYADAYFLLTQIELSENNTKQAIESAELAAILSPNNSGVFFQLGLLKYNAGDYLGAVDALSYAVNLVSDYANAKYFLGLSLEELGRHDEAVRQFEDLAKTNPDNEEVLAILANLKANRDPFFQIPSSVSNVESRTNPPITETDL